MEHSVQAYLKRLPFEIIMRLLREAVDKDDKGMVYIILDELEERMQQKTL